MSKLKTLKDMPFVRLCSDELIYASIDKENMRLKNKVTTWYDLRQEAIKYIKKYESEEMGFTDEEGQPYIKAVVAFIKHFFNIQESDLK